MPEYELKNIVTQGRKEVPQATVLAVALGRLPGTVTIRVQLPGQQAGPSIRTLRSATVPLNFPSS
jgi:hypothetical protein